VTLGLRRLHTDEAGLTPSEYPGDVFDELLGHLAGEGCCRPDIGLWAEVQASVGSACWTRTVFRCNGVS